jgi:hypothetical protein
VTCLNHCQQQAKAKRASGKCGSDSAFTDDPFEELLDPDFEPEPEAEKLGPDNEEGNCKLTFSLVLDGEETVCRHRIGGSRSE